MNNRKKYYKRVGNRLIGYGDPNYTIAPSTKRGDSYCARSYGQMKMFPEAASNPNSPLRLSRAKWRCRGKVSLRE